MAVALLLIYVVIFNPLKIYSFDKLNKKEEDNRNKGNFILNKKQLSMFATIL